jgi:PKD repeat protein
MSLPDRTDFLKQTKAKIFLMHKFRIIAAVYFLILAISMTSAQPFTEITTPLSPVDVSSVAWGDFDNDGYLDILLTGSDTSYYHISKIYHNNGNGTFKKLTGVPLVGVYFGSVALGDYNNDGYLDILLTGLNDSNIPVSIIYKNNGDGTFTEQTSISLTGVSRGSVAWGDYNNDGYLDILLTGYNKIGIPVSIVYRNNGDNTFSEQPGISLTGVGNSSVAWGDYDNDGYLDILLTGADNSYYSVSKIYHNNGNNTFTEQTGIVLAGTSYSSVCWGDYDNDGYLDIGGINSKIYHNNGNNTFSEQPGISLTGVGNSSTAWGDYDNDGYLDFLLTGWANTKAVSKIYHNNKNSFTEDTTIALAGVTYGSVAWGDYDNDGSLDILLTGDNGPLTWNAKIYHNGNSKKNVPPNSPNGLNEIIEGTQCKFIWNPVKNDETPYKGLTYNIRVGKTSGKGEVVSPMSLYPSGIRNVAAMGNCQHDTSFILKNIYPGTYYWSVQAVDNCFSGGVFAPEKVFTIDSVQASELNAKIIDSTSMQAQWKRGNGSRCVVFCKMGHSIRQMPLQGKSYIADNTFGYGDQIGTTGWYCIYNGQADSVFLKGLAPNTEYTVEVIEYLGPSGSEHYYSKHSNANDDIGFFNTSLITEQTGISLTGMMYSSAAWGDYNNDGWLDFIISGFTNPGCKSKLYKNNGDGTFSEQTGISLTGVASGSVTWGDYDNDGYLDLLLTGSSDSSDYTYTSKIYHNNGNNTFTEQTNIILDKVVNSSAAWGDYDNDGYLDILLTGFSDSFNPVSKVYHNNGNNTFTEQTSIKLTGVGNGSVSWGDYDNDGNLDILLTGATGTSPNNPVSKIYRNNGDGTFSEQTNIHLTGVYNGSASWGDYDNDGYLDILLSGSDSSGNKVTKIYHNNGNGTFTEQTRISLIGLTLSSAVWGDYDNDGFLDILLTGYFSWTGSVLKIYHNNGDNTFSEQTGISIPGVSFGSVAWGDYDNDGDLDILLTGGLNSYPVSKIYNNNTIVKTGTCFANLKPKAPSNLSQTFLPGSVKLQWSSVTTDETPAKTMSYNVRLHKNIDTIWRAASQAADSGLRRVAAYGNCQLNAFYIFKNLKQAKYYWQVQAVDQGFKGGDWSVVDSFEVRACQAFFKNDTVCFGLSTHFTDQSVASDSIISHVWSFGDGQKSNQINPVHKYSSSGTYNAKLVITSISSKDSIEHDVIVKASPIAGFTALNVCEGTTVTFTNSSKSNGFTINNWLWQFGDGQTSITEQPGNHTYANKGTYDAKLNIIAANGCGDSISEDVVLADIPNVAISVNGSTTICQGDIVQLTVTSQSNYSYQWQLDNNNLTGANKNTYIVKSGSGAYKVKVSNKLATQCNSTSDPVSIEIKEKPAAPIISELSNISIYCPGTLIHLQVDQSSDSYTYQWKRNSVHIDNATQPVLEGKLPGGAYSLEVSEGGCNVESSYLNLTTKPAPAKPKIFAEGPNVWVLGCSNDTATDYRWYYNGQLIKGAKGYIYIADKNLGEYYVAINNGGECYTSSDIISIPSGQIINGIEYLTADKVIVFPNPSNGQFTIYTGSKDTEKILLEITDINGKAVYKKKIKSIETIDIKKMGKGLYLIKLTKNKKVKIIKHLIQ